MKLKYVFEVKPEKIDGTHNNYFIRAVLFSDLGPSKLEEMYKKLVNNEEYSALHDAHSTIHDPGTEYNETSLEIKYEGNEDPVDVMNLLKSLLEKLVVE